MKPFINTTLTLTLFLVSFFVWGQKISYKRVYTKDITPALIEDLKEPKGFVLNTFMRNSNNSIPNYNGVISLGIDSDIIKENRAYPDYIMELELINKSPKVFVFDIIDSETKQKLKNIYIISQIEAIQYLTEKDKGFFFDRDIALKRSTGNLKYSGIDDVTKYDYSMKLSGKDYSNSVLAFKSVKPSSVSNYVTPAGDGWITKKEYVTKVNSVQAHKLYANSVNYLEKLFNSSDRKKPYTIDYIKKWKENESLMTQYNEVI